MSVVLSVGMWSKVNIKHSAIDGDGGPLRLMPLSTILAVSFIGGGNQRTPLTCSKSLANFII
jgi:hypothetical protein